MAANEPLVPLSEIEREANWPVRSNGVVVSDWAGRAAVPVSVAAELFERAVAERDRLAVERNAARAAAERRRPRGGGVPAVEGLSALESMLTAGDPEPPWKNQRVTVAEEILGIGRPK